jgi:hypothetical protein
MKRLIASSLILGILSLVSFVGCGEEPKPETKGTTTTPAPGPAEPTKPAPEPSKEAPKTP